MVPCVLFEDDDLLVINKPAGLNTHAPNPFAGEGIYDWLRHREPRWASLAIIHRLDKETSGVMVFSKTARANRSLTEQFAQHQVRKKYLLLTDRFVSHKNFAVKSALVRAGEKYLSRPLHAGAEIAETRFRLAEASGFCRKPASGQVLEAEPVTGRTHQVRAHAADKGLPVLGDRQYGGSPAGRLCLHSAELLLEHPLTRRRMRFWAPVDFTADIRVQLRQAVVEPENTDAYRVNHGASDGWPGWYVTQFGTYLLSQAAGPLSMQQRKELALLARLLEARGVYHQVLRRTMRGADLAALCPQLVVGQGAPARFVVRENGLAFELSFGEGYSVGLFLDQRDNRRRLLTGHVAAGFELHGSGQAAVKPGCATPIIAIRQGGCCTVLNVFAYTCAFSVCAAKAGACTTNLDLSKKYLEWGKRNFQLNELDPARHDFLYGDVFDWLPRLARKRRAFDVVLLDPPTFSHSKGFGVFRAQRNYEELVALGLPLLKPGGVLFASTNAADWSPDKFLAAVEAAVRTAKRKTLLRHYVPQPPDFPISRSEPAYLKTVWLQIE